MKENKLGTYLTSFTEKDWASYFWFSKSLYTVDSDYQSVINYIKKHKNRYDPSFMDNEYLRKKIKPKAKKEIFANVISKLCKHIERYLIWSEIESDRMTQDTLLLKALGKRGMSDFFHKHKEKSKISITKSPKGLWNNYHEFMTEYLLYFCNMTSDIKQSKIALKSAYESLKKFCGILNHYLILEMHNRNILVKEVWEDEISEFTNNYKIKHDFSEILDNLIEMKVSKTEESYKKLIRKVENENISKEIRYTILIHLRSYLSFRIIKGDLTVTPKLLDLQKYGLEKGILFPSGRIPVIRFTNILNTASSLKEYDWAIKFVTDWCHLVDNKNINETKTLGYAQIEFNKQNFEKVIDLLIELKFKNCEFELKAKWLLLCSNYEINIDNYSIIEYNINTFKYFLKRNKSNTTELTFLSYMNCAKYILQIAKKSEINKSIEKIKNEKNLFFRSWILKKAMEKL